MQMALEKNRVNVKLLAFLKKALPEREYRCLCFQSCEPCMVETEDDSKVQKHVFCTSNRLYVVDSGLKAEPKALCALEDILQVRKTDSLPCFLSKKDAEETVHVQVVYQSQVPENRTTGSVMARSPGFFKRLLGTDRRQAASTDSLSSSGGDLEELCTGQQSPNGSSATLVPPVSEGEQACSTETRLQERHACAGSPEGSSSRAALGKGSSTVPFPMDGSSQSIASNVKGSPHPLRSSTSPSTSDPHQLFDRLPSQSPPGANIVRREKQKTSPLCLSSMASLQAALNRDKPSVAMQRPSVTLYGDSMTHGNIRPQMQKVYDSPVSGSPMFFKDSGAAGTWRSASSLPLATLQDSSNPRRSHSMDFDKTAGRHAQSPAILHKGPRSLQSIDSIHTQSTTEGAPTCLRKVTAELYILNRRSHFHQHLMFTWERRLLSLTWLMGDTAVLPSLEMPSQEKLRANYQKLQYEVLCCAECLEGTAKLLQELATACQKYEEIRQFFWEDGTLLTVCCRLLQEHLPPSVTMATKEQRPIHRADQLELSILSMNVLYHMLRGRAYITEKMKQLASERGQSMLSLQSAVMAPLTDPLERQPTSGSEKDEVCCPACIPSGALAFFKQRSGHLRLKKAGTSDQNILKLCSEATDTSASVLSELALASQQQWRAVGPHQPTPTWFAEAIAVHSNSVEYFSRLVTRCSRLLQSKQLTPEEAITVYHIFHLLLFSCSNNAAMLQRCRESFREEVRYYLRLSVCQNIIADHVPLKKRTLQFLKELKSLLREVA